MKAHYPNSLRQDKYVTVLTAIYQQKYPEFSKEQIRCYTYEMAVVITRQINTVESYDGQTSRINTLQSLKKLPELVAGSSTIFRLFIYLGRRDADWMEEVVRGDLKLREIPFPEEHKTKYLRFISDITAKVINDICDTTKAKLIGSKMPEDRSAGSKRSRSEDKPLSFVEKVGRGSKPAKEEKTSFSEKEQKKKLRVRFADDKLSLGKG